MMKLLRLTSLMCCVSPAGLASASTIELIGMFDQEWNYMVPDSDPELGDSDFDSTWMLTEAQFDAIYDGPSFTGDTTTGPTTATGGSGKAVLGFGTINFSPVQTVVSLSPRQTSYLRTTFTVPNLPLEAGSVFAEVLADDGAVFYLDGVQVQVHPLLTGLNCCDADGKTTVGPNVADDYNAFARTSGTENSLTSILFPDLTPGTHTLAVSVHQVVPLNADMGFALSLAATVPTPEPSSSLLLALGCCLLCGCGWRRFARRGL